jgi:hypothetical protein
MMVVFLALFSLAAWSPVHAEDMTCPPPLAVNIDIKPGSSSNVIKLSSQGLVPVAVLSTDGFDASQFTPEMAHLLDSSNPMAGSCSGAMAVRWKVDDVNKDGLPDLIFFFNTQDLGFTSSTTSATFMAHGYYLGTEIHIMGMDTVKTIP